MGCPSRARAGRAAGSGLDLGAVEQPGEHHRMRGPAQLSLARAMWVSVSLRPGTSGRQYSTTRYRPACSNATRSERAAIWLSTGSMRGSSTPEWGDQQRQPDRREAVEDRAVLGSDVPAGDHQHVVAQAEPVKVLQHGEGVRLDDRQERVGGAVEHLDRGHVGLEEPVADQELNGVLIRHERPRGLHGKTVEQVAHTIGAVQGAPDDVVEFTDRDPAIRLLSCADAEFTCSRWRIKLSASLGCRAAHRRGHAAPIAWSRRCSGRAPTRPVELADFPVDERRDLGDQVVGLPGEPTARVWLLAVMDDRVSLVCDS